MKKIISILLLMAVVGGVYAAGFERQERRGFKNSFEEASGIGNKTQKEGASLNAAPDGDPLGVPVGNATAWVVGCALVYGVTVLRRKQQEIAKI
jgi:hypothetical protein